MIISPALFSAVAGLAVAVVWPSIATCRSLAMPLHPVAPVEVHLGGRADSHSDPESSIDLKGPLAAMVTGHPNGGSDLCLHEGPEMDPAGPPTSQAGPLIHPAGPPPSIAGIKAPGPMGPVPDEGPMIHPAGPPISEEGSSIDPAGPPGSQAGPVIDLAGLSAPPGLYTHGGIDAGSVAGPEIDPNGASARISGTHPVHATSDERVSIELAGPPIGPKGLGLSEAGSSVDPNGVPTTEAGPAIDPNGPPAALTAVYTQGEVKPDSDAGPAIDPNGLRLALVRVGEPCQLSHGSEASTPVGHQVQSQRRVDDVSPDVRGDEGPLIHQAEGLGLR